MRVERAATPVPSTRDLTANDVLSVSQAVALVGSRARRNADDDRSARDRARKLLTYHIKKGTLVVLPDGTLRVRELGRFLRKKYPGKFNDLSGGDVSTLVSRVALPTILVSAVATLLPNDLTRCHAEIERLTERANTLMRDLSAAKQRIAELEPDAKKWRAQVLKLTRNARARRDR